MDNRLVLVVEGDEGLREVLTDVVTFLGFAVKVARDASEALVLAREERPSAILLDISGRCGNDYQAVELIQGDPATNVVPLIALHDVQPPGTTAPRAVTEVLGRPFDLGDLEVALRSHLEPTPN